MRTIILGYDEGFMDAVDGNADKAQAAVGYLASWAIGTPRYYSVSIWGDSRGCLNATYAGIDGEQTYEMLGLRSDDGTYSFHS